MVGLVAAPEQRAAGTATTPARRDVDEGSDTKAAPAERAVATRSGGTKTVPKKAITRKEAGGAPAVTDPLAEVSVSGEPERRAVPTSSGAGVPPDVLVVRDEESPWTSAELDQVREQLQAEFGRISDEATALQTNIADVLRDTGDGSGDDQADTGAKAFEREQEMTLLATVRESQFQTEHALQRIADGTYGICEACGNAIGKLRLQAFPRATLCVGCKQRQERR